jgi:heme exporter protein D
VITLLAAAPELPLGKSGKFVAAAYAVFVVIILIYVAIMAVRAQRIERDLAQLQRDVEEARAQRGDAAGPPAPGLPPERSGSLL